MGRVQEPSGPEGSCYPEGMSNKGYLWLAAVVCLLSLPMRAEDAGSGWPTYGGDAGGQRYSNASQINRQNISKLRPVWTYHTHVLASRNANVTRTDFEATPILYREALYLTTPLDRVIALDATTGSELWTFEPELPADLLAANYTSRGVAIWESTAEKGGACSSRVFLATLDARLIALDAATGRRCGGFGENGQVDLKTGVPTRASAPYRFFGNTSPPTVVGSVVVVGSAVGDNQAIDVEPGYVRGFDALSGRLLWTWDAMPWAREQKVRTGGGNAWGVISADLENGLIFVPTGSPSPDFYGGQRPGNNADANSVVAIEARTGRKVWSFQLVHHDLWDYDVATEPLLFTFRGRTAAVAVGSKMGVLFVLNRLTGAPLYPVEERPVPRSDVAGEQSSPTQPFTALPPLTRQSFDPLELAGQSPADTATCSQKLAHLRYEGPYTPPSLQGTLQFPGSLGGVNWASMSLDPRTGILYANTNGSAYEIRLVPQIPETRARGAGLHWHRRWLAAGVTVAFAGLLVLLVRRPTQRMLLIVAAFLLVGFWRAHSEEPKGEGPKAKFLNSPDASGETSPQAGTPFRIFRKVLQDDQGRPCTLPPWGKTIAVNLNTGRLEWERPLGTMIAHAQTGTVNFGAPILTSTGLLFTAGYQQPEIEALDAKTGEELWKGALPVPAQSTPMTYEIKGRQFVVVDAGGHGGLGTPLGDSVIAFALP
ncbi:MAG: hypothetical protein NVSMB3_00540 [Acidobacteriaceae bacterium]